MDRKHCFCNCQLRNAKLIFFSIADRNKAHTFNDLESKLSELLGSTSQSETVDTLFSVASDSCLRYTQLYFLIIDKLRNIKLNYALAFLRNKTLSHRNGLAQEQKPESQNSRARNKSLLNFCGSE